MDRGWRRTIAAYAPRVQNHTALRISIPNLFNLFSVPLRPISAFRVSGSHQHDKGIRSRPVKMGVSDRRRLSQRREGKRCPDRSICFRSSGHGKALIHQGLGDPCHEHKRLLGRLASTERNYLPASQARPVCDDR